MPAIGGLMVVSSQHGGGPPSRWGAVLRLAGAAPLPESARGHFKLHWGHGASKARRKGPAFAWPKSGP